MEAIMITTISFTQIPESQCKTGNINLRSSQSYEHETEASDSR